jgi:hypothetical protein
MGAAVTPDAQFWPDMALLGLLLVAQLLAVLFWRRTVGRLPAQQPGDAGGLAHGLATIGCAGAAAIAFVCAALYVMLAVWGRP